MSGAQANPNVPSNSIDLPANNNPLAEQAANHGPSTSNPVKQSSSDRPTTEKEATEKANAASDTKSGIMNKVSDAVDSATGKIGSGGPANPSN